MIEALERGKENPENIVKGFVPCSMDVIDWLIELLQDGEPKLLTKAELRSAAMFGWHMKNGAFWLETSMGAFAPCFTDCAHNDELRVWSIYLHPANIDSNVTWWKFEYFGKTWRVWDRRPTEEQRRAVKWE